MSQSAEEMKSCFGDLLPSEELQRLPGLRGHLLPFSAAGNSGTEPGWQDSSRCSVPSSEQARLHRAVPQSTSDATTINSPACKPLKMQCQNTMQFIGGGNQSSTFNQLQGELGSKFLLKVLIQVLERMAQHAGRVQM